MRGGGAEAKTASVILAHPYEKSFNHAIFAAAMAALRARGISVFAHDLYAEGFDPVLTRAELGKEETQDPLAALVHTGTGRFRSARLHPSELVGAASRDHERLHRPRIQARPTPTTTMKARRDRPRSRERLVGKIGIVFNTSNTEEVRENEYFHDPLEHEWLKCVFGFCGIERCSRRMFRVVAQSGAEERGAMARDGEGRYRGVPVARGAKTAPGGWNGGGTDGEDRVDDPPGD